MGEPEITVAAFVEWALDYHDAPFAASCSARAPAALSSVPKVHGSVFRRGV